MEEIRIVRDDAVEFVIDGNYRGDASWGITEASGFGEIDVTTTTEKYAIGDGEAITSEYVGSRPLEIEARVKHSADYASGRREALRFFLPKRTYIVYATSHGVTRWIAAHIEKMKCPDPPAGRPVVLNLALTCSDPYWNDTDSFGNDIAAKSGGMVFPYRVPIGGGFNTGRYLYSDNVSLDNGGDIPTNIIVTITASGEVQNPKVTINDAFVRMILSMESGDVLVLDMENDRITLNGVNAIGKIDKESRITDIELPPGNSQITFSADSGDANMSVVVNYTPKYVGV
jgi:hypothetical protein